MTTNAIDTGTDHLLAELDSGALTLTMNRPEARNALSGEMIAAFSTQLAQAEINPDVRCILVTGAGKGFCAGGDIKGMAKPRASQRNSPNPSPSVDARIHLQRIDQRAVSGRLFSIPKPTLAALPGPAAGAGMGIALSCDLRIMANNAIFTTAFVKVGFSGDYGATYFLTQLVGTSKARELFYFSDRIDSQEALRLGLTNWVCEPEELADKSREIAKRLASGPPVALRHLKENINCALNNPDFGECMDLESTNMARCRETQDHQNAVRAFLAREEPVFTGR